jgi:Holliday junction resolvase RusA-like endonuclease
VSTLLLIASLGIPPSVNSRTIITPRGGTLHPKARQYYQESHLRLLSTETVTFPDAIVEARDTHAFLSVSMWFYLPLAKKPKTRGTYFLSRDLDNMAQLPLNVLKSYLGIDDVQVADIHSYKRILPPSEKHPFVLIRVNAMKRDALDLPPETLLAVA